MLARRAAFRSGQWPGRKPPILASGQGASAAPSRAAQRVSDSAAALGAQADCKPIGALPSPPECVSDSAAASGALAGAVYAVL